MELREFARPVPGAEDVILAVEAVGVCSTSVPTMARAAGTIMAHRNEIASARKPISGGPTMNPKYEIPEIMAKAFYIAKSGRPGPVLIDITKDAQISEFDFSYKKSWW